MDVDITCELLDQIVEATEFKTMKKAKRDGEEKYRAIFGEQFSMYRKGKWSSFNLANLCSRTCLNYVFVLLYSNYRIKSG